MSPPSAHPSPRLPGTIAGRYQPVRELGRGGMGAVYEAVHTWTGRRVAVKTLLPHLADDAGAIERFRREARAGVQGAHPHIVEVLDMGVDPDDGTAYLVHELLTGEDLAALLAREAPLSLRRTYEALVPVMAALHAAHRAGVVHRDVKPGNVFLARSASGAITPKVIDFGIAALADAAPVTRTGAPIGTPQYMAPEQARGARDVDARADVWAVGCLWYEALTGRRPIAGESYPALIAALLAASAPSLRAVAPDAPSAVCEAVDGALQPDRALRHQNMAAFARALLAAPCCAIEPWGAALAEAHPFAETADAPADTAPLAPTTLELPATDAAPGPTPATPPKPERSATPSPTPAPTPSPVPAATPAPTPAPVPAATPLWRAIAIAATALALASTTALALRRASSGTVPAPAPSAPPITRVTSTEPPSTRPSSVEQPPGPAIALAPDTPTTRAVSPDAGALPLATTPRRRVRPHGIDARAPRPTVINGAPVLEP